MDQADTSLRYISVNLAFPPVARFTGGQLAELFASVQEPYGFESFRQQSDSGATFETEGQRKLEISRDEIFFETLPEEHITHVKREVAGLIDEVVRHCRVRAFVVPKVVLRAIWQAPPGSPSVVTFLRDRVDFDDSATNLLGELDGVSFTFAGRVDEPESPSHRHWTLEMAPLYRDKKEESVWLELQTNFYEPAVEVAAVEQSVETCYNFLHSNTVPFLQQAFAEPGEDGGERQSDDDDR